MIKGVRHNDKSERIETVGSGLARDSRTGFFKELPRIASRGIGISKQRALEGANWKRDNILGQALMTVREGIMITSDSN